MPRSRAFSRRIAVVLGSALLGLLALEVVLRILPLKRASALANDVYSAYGSFPGGIYFTDPETGINFMVPGFETENFCNGHSWLHRTDALGFRNPPGLHGRKDRPVLLLGDSLIYGHGVDEEHTVSHVLRSKYGRPVYNMARQGDCLFQQHVLLRLYLAELRPRQVVIFVFLNDFHDLLSYRTDEELARLPELSLDFGAMRRRVTGLGREPEYPFHRQAYRFRSLRLLRGLARYFRGSWIAQAEAAPEAPGDLAAAVLGPEPFQKAGGYYGGVLAETQRLLAAAGVDFWVVLLDVGPVAGPDGQRAYERLEVFLSQASRDLGFSFATTEGVFTDCGDCFLAHDGHFSPQGHARLARFLESTVLSR
jgi:hypothetical protein